MLHNHLYPLPLKSLPNVNTALLCSTMFGLFHTFSLRAKYLFDFRTSTTNSRIRGSLWGASTRWLRVWRQLCGHHDSSGIFYSRPTLPDKAVFPVCSNETWNLREKISCHSDRTSIMTSSLPPVYLFSISTSLGRFRMHSIRWNQ